MKNLKMQKLVALVFILSASVLRPAIGLTGEAAAPEMVQGVLKGSLPESNPFIVNMTPRGGVLAKTGSVFTEDGHYENITLPYLLANPAPIPYPRWAVRQGWQGRFDIALEILKDGSVGPTQVMRSTGYSLLDQSAEKAVKKWKFHPAIENGQPVATCIQMPVLFQIEKD